MTSASATHNAFTDAPELHPNLIVGSLQMLFWLFVHPSAWRSYIARIDQTLRPDFALVELSRVHWRSPLMRRLLVMGYLVWPIMGGILSGLALWASGQPGESVAIGVAIGVAFGVVASFAGGVAGSVVGYLASVVLGPALESVVGFYAVVLFFEVTLGFAGGVIGSTGVRRSTSSTGRQLGSVVLGFLIGSMSALAALFLVLNLAQVLTGYQVIFVFGASMIGGFSLSRAIADRIAGTWAGVVAGGLAVGGFAVLLQGTFIEPRGTWNTVFIGVVAPALGMTLAFWLTVLVYPLTMAWNKVLYYADLRRLHRQSRLLRWHSAFWDEHQRLPIYGLEDHLVLMAERSPGEAARAMAYLAVSRQRWAAQAAQIELDARRLERCNQVEAIGQAHRILAAGELEGPASALLRSFSRISQDVEAALRQESSYNQRLALRAVEDDLDGLLRELTRSSDRYAVRFTPIATHWHSIVASHVQELAAAVELRQEIDSPYVIGVPLTRQQEIFVGRTDIGARIEQLLLDRRRPPLLLYGQRRTGKTSLLNNLGRLLPNSIVPLFVDLQGPAAQASDHAGFLYNLARGMTDSAQRERGLALPPLERESLTADPFTRFDEWLDQVETALGRNTALLSLDEFEALDRALTQGRFSDADVLGMLRNLIQHRPRFKVLLAGSHTLEELERWAGYLINVQVVHISYLKEDEARRLVEQPVMDFALRYESDASQRVLDLTRCHPFLVQLLCGEIVALKNEQEVAVRRLARLPDVEAAASEALSHGSFFFADIERNQVDADGLALLRALAAQGEGAAMSREQLAAQLPDPERLGRSLASLIQRELIEPADGGYRFQVELIRRWFAQKRGV